MRAARGCAFDGRAQNLVHKTGEAPAIVTLSKNEIEFCEVRCLDVPPGRFQVSKKRARLCELRFLIALKGGRAHGPKVKLNATGEQHLFQFRLADRGNYP